MANYVLIERIELNASAASVTFSNIPQTGYTDLKIVYSARSTVASTLTGLGLAFNGGRTTSARRLFGNDGSVYSDTNIGNGQGEAGFSDGSTATASTFSNSEIYIPNYTGSQQKSYSVDSVTENNSSTGYVTAFIAGLNSTTSAITSITISENTGNALASGSTFSLYGIAAVGTTPAIAPKADGGNVIATDGTYWYHAFLSNGTFTPAVGLSCDYLVVSGGGGGNNGGGGAGGLRAITAQTLTATNYPVVIGAGGAGKAADDVSLATSGIASSFNSFTTSPGGKGGNYAVNPDAAGTAGGSGGGAGPYPSGSPSSGGAGNSGGYSPVEGYAGGIGGIGGNTSRAGGGGGGAGGAGADAGQNTGQGGVGGSGANSYNSITFTSWLTATGTGSSSYLAGGGAGMSQGGSSKAGGIGGGGANGVGTNSSGTDATAGVVNTGSGGGGGIYWKTGGNGGSGIVIIRYAVA